MRRPPVISLLLLWVAARPARAEVFSLAEAERRAGAGDSALASSARTAQADADLEATRDARRPTITFEADANTAPGGQLLDLTTADGQHFLVQGSRRISEPGAFLPVPRWGGVLSLQANVFDFGRTTGRIRAAEHRARSSRSDEQAVRAQNIRVARDAYLAWAVAFARLRLADERGRDVRSQTEMVLRMIAEGARPRADESVARQEQVAADLEISDAHGELDRSEMALRQIVGDPWKPPYVPDLDVLEAQATEPGLGPASDAAALEELAAAATVLADSLAHTHAPLLSAAGEAGVRGQGSSTFPAYRVGLTLTVPLWDGGVGAAQARAARAQAHQLRAEARTLLEGHRDEREALIDELARARERLGLADQLRRLAEDEVAQASERYRLGAVDLRALFEARERLWNAQSQQLVAKAARARAALRARP